MRRLWKAPKSHAWWLFLGGSTLFYAAVFYLYYRTVKVPGFHDAPGTGSLARFGLIAIGMVMVTATYTLRRRFMRFLPGKAHDWLWMHTWVGVITILIAMLHANFDHVLRGYCMTPRCLTGANGGPLALYALILLVGSGIFGRLLDIWQTRVIANDASTNGVGIAQALEERISELEYTVERLYAGKSEPFQQFYMQALGREKEIPGVIPALAAYEQSDFRRTYEILIERRRLLESLQRQNHARLIIRRWRNIHIALVCVALTMIGLHLGMLAFSRFKLFGHL